MGDRVKVVCRSVYAVSPAIYAHWLGSEAKEIIRGAWATMRHGDARYASAALCAAFVREATRKDAPHEISVGLYGPPANLSREFLTGEYNPGDAGIYVVDVDTGLVENFRRYGDEDATFSLPMRPLGDAGNGWDQDNSVEIAKREAARAARPDKEQGT